jgi:hypothetical protein
LVLAFASSALFFGFRAGRYIFATNRIGLEAEPEALAEFFIDAVVTCLLLVPSIVVGWLVAREPHERAAG